MNYAIFRVVKRNLQQASSMAEHALREVPTPNADPSRTIVNLGRRHQTSAEVVAELRARTKPLVKRKDAVRVLEFFVGASPEVIKSMPENSQNAYFLDARQWLVDLFGGDPANVVCAVVHRDETSPHLQVLLTPIVDGKLAASKVIGGPSGLRLLQDRFANEVGAKYSLRRGEKGSKAEHIEVGKYYGAVLAASSMTALPKPVRIPPEPKPLSFLASAAAKAEFAEQQANREKALAESRRRLELLKQLASMQLATSEMSRRRHAARIQEFEQREAASAAKAKLALEEIGRREREVLAREQHAAALSTEIAQLLNELSDEQRVKVIKRVNEKMDNRLSSEVLRSLGQHHKQLGP